jgi:RimJ/RimL family protein N-acetyltransferase
MKIRTERLILEPFTTNLIDFALAKNYSKIETLGYIATDEWPEKDLIEALPVFKKLIEENGKNGFNNWIIILKQNNKIIGSAGYIGNPDEFGNIEIGFGIIPSERRNGYCYEAVNELIKWALKQKNVFCIKASCEETNNSSKKMIQRLGFKEIKNVNGLIEWEYKISDTK